MSSLTDRGINLRYRGGWWVRDRRWEGRRRRRCITASVWAGQQVVVQHRGGAALTEGRKWCRRQARRCLEMNAAAAAASVAPEEVRAKIGKNLAFIIIA